MFPTDNGYFNLLWGAVREGEMEKPPRETPAEEHARIEADIARLRAKNDGPFNA